MYIHFQLTAIAPNDTSKGKGKARATMQTSVKKQHLAFVQDRMTGFFAEHICRLIQLHNICSRKSERAWDPFYDIIFLDPVTTRHFSQLQLM
jgi:hypothetical protein